VRPALYARKWLIYRGVGRRASGEKGKREERASFNLTEGKMYQKGEMKIIVSIMIHIVCQKMMRTFHTLRSDNAPFILNRDYRIDPTAVEALEFFETLISN
jgi:glutamate/tyrosine decarboxylase-like PLP-dependent enzyme